MRSFGRYRLEQRLGRGGMAEVCRATAIAEDGSESKVAVKRILPELANDPKTQRMFLDEARIASQLHHSGIVGVIDFGMAQGVAMQVLEYVEGIDGWQLLRSLPDGAAGLPLGLALYLGVQVAQALDYAHDACDSEGRPLHVVHRDVTPSNVLLGWNGDVRLSDFGIALATNRLEKTVTGGAKGKEQYMAPEQAARETVDRRADVFALACTVHAFAVGASPLAAPGALPKLLLRGESVAVDASLPEAVRRLLERALARSPDARPATAGAFAKELEGLRRSVMKEEPRTELIRLLERVRETQRTRPATHSKRSLDLDIVLRDVTADGVRRFDVDQTNPDAQLADTNTQPIATLPEQTPPRGTRRYAALGALALVALTVGAIALWSQRTTSSPTPVPGQRDTPDSTANRQTSNTTASMGSIEIGGPGAVRAEIRVDGRSVGYAPQRLDVALGAHRFDVVGTDGKFIATRTMEITEQHTTAAPARWLVPDTVK